MAPTLVAGDRVVTVPWGRLRIGDLVVAHDPREPERVIVKRLAGTSTAGLVVHGDNPAGSTDSRHFGPVPRSLVVGRVVYRYAPPERVGRINRSGPAARPA